VWNVYQCLAACGGGSTEGGEGIHRRRHVSSEVICVFPVRGFSPRWNCCEMPVDWCRPRTRGFTSG
jgi:hypothetical protein